MVNLLEAFSRWEKECGQLVSAEVDVQAIAIGLGLGSRVQYSRPPHTPAPIEYITTLPCVDVEELSEHDRECGICTRPMCSPKDVIDFLTVDEAGLRLPCSHIIGSRCLTEWFSPFLGSNNNTCPYCRAVCFAQFPPKHTLQGSQERLNTIDWALEGLGRAPSPDEKERITELASGIFKYALNEAILEFERDRLEANEGAPGSTPLLLSLRGAVIHNLNSVYVLTEVGQSLGQSQASTIGGQTPANEEQETGHNAGISHGGDAAQPEEDEEEPMIQVFVDGQRVQPNVRELSDDEEIENVTVVSDDGEIDFS